ncbi:MAG: nucleotidyltransferase, partial [uncultured bacterium]
FRMATERHLIKDIEAWFDYHQKRNKTSHTYDENTAEEVFNAALLFVLDAKYLLDSLEAKND